MQSISLSKINYLHLHISDDDSIPMDLPSFPDLTKYAAWSEKETYSVNQIKDLIAYAKTFGIEVIPEFDLPAHAMGFSQYPSLKDLILCTDRQWHYTYPDGG